MRYWTSCLYGTVTKQSGGRQTRFITTSKFKIIYWNGLVSFLRRLPSLLLMPLQDRVSEIFSFQHWIFFNSLVIVLPHKRAQANRGGSGDPIQNFSSKWGCDRPSKTLPRFDYIQAFVTPSKQIFRAGRKKKNKKKKIKRGKQLSARHLKRRTENKQNTASLNLKAQYINKQMILI